MLVLYLFTHNITTITLLFANGTKRAFESLEAIQFNEETINIIQNLKVRKNTPIDIAKLLTHSIIYAEAIPKDKNDTADDDVEIYLRIDESTYEVFTSNFEDQMDKYLGANILMQAINSESFKIFQFRSQIIKKILHDFLERIVLTQYVYMEFFKMCEKYVLVSENASKIIESVQSDDYSKLMKLRAQLIDEIFSPEEELKKFNDNTFENDYLHWECAYSNLFEEFRKIFNIQLIFEGKLADFTIGENYQKQKNCDILNITVEKFFDSGFFNIFKYFTFFLSYFSEETEKNILTIMIDFHPKNILFDLTDFYLNLMKLNISKMNDQMNLFDLFLMNLLKYRKYLYMRIRTFNFILDYNKKSNSYNLHVAKNSKYHFFDQILSTSAKINYYLSNGKKKSAILTIALVYIDSYLKSQSEIVYHQFCNFLNQDYSNCLGYIKLGEKQDKIINMEIDHQKYELDENMNLLTINVKKSYFDKIKQDLFKGKIKIRHFNGIISENNCLLEIVLDSVQESNVELSKDEVKLKNVDLNQKFTTFDIEFRRIFRLKSKNALSCISYYKIEISKYSLYIYECDVEFLLMIARNILNVDLIGCRLISCYSLSSLSPKKYYQQITNLLFLDSIFDENFELNGIYNEIIVKYCSLGSKLKIDAKFNIIEVYGIIDECTIKNKYVFTFIGQSHDSHFKYNVAMKTVEGFNILLFENSTHKELKCTIMNR